MSDCARSESVSDGDRRARPVTEIEALLESLRQGDANAAARVLEVTYPSLRRLSRQLLRTWPGVRRWDETDDVCQSAAIRLYRSLTEVRPASPLHYFRLAGLQIRRTLLELARRHTGANGLATNLDTNGGDLQRSCDRTQNDPDDPPSLAEWIEFHQFVAELPDDARDVFEVIWYGGLDLKAAAAVLQVSESTVKRRWRHARQQLGERLGTMPLA